MDYVNIELEYLSEYNSFGVADKVIEDLANKNIVPIITLKDEDYSRIGCNLPRKKAPLIAFLLGRETGYYTIDFSYAKTLALCGVRLRFLTYGQNVDQMNGVDGLMLPGGEFDSHCEFYAKVDEKTDNSLKVRSWAYVTSIIEARKNMMPILGVCAGAQIVGAMHGLKMLNNVEDYSSVVYAHKSEFMNAHKIVVDKKSPLYKILRCKVLVVNSRHEEAMLNCDENSLLKIYALSEDGVPEAWGSEKENMLCVQWHPEDFACNGDKRMQKIYNWLAIKAKSYKKQKNNMNIMNRLWNFVAQKRIRK